MILEFLARRGVGLKWMQHTLLFVIGLLFTSSAALANSGIPIVMLGLPFAILMLIPVVVIETLIFARVTKIGSRRSWKPILVANLISTLLGYPLAWIIQLALQFLFMAVASGHSGESAFWNSLPVKMLGYALVSAWIPPAIGDIWWWIPLAGIVGLVPAFFLSIHFEFKVTRRFLGEKVPPLRSAILRANIASYMLLFFSLLAILAWNYLT